MIKLRMVGHEGYRFLVLRMTGVDGAVIVVRMKPILLEIVNRLSEIGASVGALEAALIHTRQLTTGDVKRLLDGHKANVETQLAQLRVSIAALPD